MYEHPWCTTTSDRANRFWHLADRIRTANTAESSHGALHRAEQSFRRSMATKKTIGVRTRCSLKRECYDNESVCIREHPHANYFMRYRDSICPPSLYNALFQTGGSILVTISATNWNGKHNYRPSVSIHLAFFDRSVSGWTDAERW